MNKIDALLKIDPIDFGKEPPEEPTYDPDPDPVPWFE